MYCIQLYKFKITRKRLNDLSNFHLYKLRVLTPTVSPQRVFVCSVIPHYQPAFSVYFQLAGFPDERYQNSSTWSLRWCSGPESSWWPLAWQVPNWMSVQFQKCFSRHVLRDGEYVWVPEETCVLSSMQQLLQGWRNKKNLTLEREEVAVKHGGNPAEFQCRLFISQHKISVPQRFFHPT